MRVQIDAKGMSYTELNRQLRAAVAEGADAIVVDNVLGQRFIADGLKGDGVTITLNGVPGGDLGMFMSGPTLVVHGNAEHAPGNTMDSGTIIVHGNAGDAVAHSMRGGRIYVRDSIGYRGGIHMKQYLEKRPILVVGDTARAFLGEYMAGGLILVLARRGSHAVSERGIGSGIHGGEILLRGEINDIYLGIGAQKKPFTEEHRKMIAPIAQDFAVQFGMDVEPLLEGDFTRIAPASSRPFASKYTWE